MFPNMGSLTQLYIKLVLTIFLHRLPGFHLVHDNSLDPRLRHFFYPLCRDNCEFHHFSSKKDTKYLMSILHLYIFCIKSVYRHAMARRMCLPLLSSNSLMASVTQDKLFLDTNEMICIVVAPSVRASEISPRCLRFLHLNENIN